MVTIYYALLAFTVVERVAEMAISRANAAWSLARGGREAGEGHFPAMVALHTAFLAACAIEPVAFDRQNHPSLFVVALTAVLACQALRWWCIATLGRQWNTRVIVVPGFERVTRGPYRWIRHPNYLAVVVEGIALPAAGGAWITAIVFTLANASLLRTRIATENRALRLLQEGGIGEPG